MFKCPKCNLIYSVYGNGHCICSDQNDKSGKLITIEENDLPLKIEWSGNTGRFCDQKKGQLIHVKSIIAKKLNPLVVECIGKDIPSKSVRQFILCIYLGENDIIFEDLINYGGSRLLKLQDNIGMWFDIDVPDTSSEPVELEFRN